MNEEQAAALAQLIEDGVLSKDEVDRIQANDAELRIEGEE